MSRMRCCRVARANTPERQRTEEDAERDSKDRQLGSHGAGNGKESKRNGGDEIPRI
jgi:hypothetical protein